MTVNDHPLTQVVLTLISSRGKLLSGKLLEEELPPATCLLPPAPASCLLPPDSEPNDSFVPELLDHQKAVSLAKGADRQNRLNVPVAIDA